MKRLFYVVLSLTLLFSTVSFLGSAKSALAASMKTVGNASWTDSGGYPHQTAIIVNGSQLVYCANANIPAPSKNGTTYNDGTVVYDRSVISLLYYGYGGDGYKGSGGNTDYVKTWVALNNWLNGATSTMYPANTDPFIASLLKHAQNQDAPSYDVHFSSNDVSSTIQNGVQESANIAVQGNHMSGNNNSHAELSIPKDVTISVYEMRNGKAVNTKTITGSDGGTSVTVWGGEWFHFTAPLTYNQNYQSGNVDADANALASILFLPESGNYQPVYQKPVIKSDPNKIAGFTVHFWARQQTLTVNHINTYNNYNMWKTTDSVTINSPYDRTSDAYNKDGSPVTFNKSGSNGVNHQFKYSSYNGHGDGLSETMPPHDVTLDLYYDPYQNVTVTYKNAMPNYDVFKTWTDVKKVSDWFSYTAPASIPSWGNEYDLISNNTWTGNVPYNDISHEFDYKLKRTVTVNYLDKRTGQEIPGTSPKTYSEYQGDTYSESPPTIKTPDGKQTYQYLNESGSSESGTLWFNNITINYYYQLPLIQAKMKQEQVYTAPAQNGLPIEVQLLKSENYPETVADMTDNNKTISVGLLQNGKEIATQKYTAKSLPTSLYFKVDPKYLTVNNKANYQVRFESYNGGDYDVPSNGVSLTVNGYTSNDLNLTINNAGTNGVNGATQKQDYPVMAENGHQDSDYNQTYSNTYNEHFQESATKIPDMKTGYGFSTKVTIKYANDLDSADQGELNKRLGISINGVSSLQPTFLTSNDLQDSYTDYPTIGSDMEMPLFRTGQLANTNPGFSTWNGTETFGFQHVNVERMTGHLFTDDQKAAHDSSIKNALVDGGYKFYSPVWPKKSSVQLPADYGVTYMTANPFGETDQSLGANKINIKITDDIHLYAYMLAHIGSETPNHDELLWEPINADNPFPFGAPSGWTQTDINWLKEE